MSNSLDTCPRCNGPQIEIDHYGEWLVGCIEFNRWSWRGSQRLLPEAASEGNGSVATEDSGFKL
jgi:hypothetical protein